MVQRHTAATVVEDAAAGLDRVVVRHRGAKQFRRTDVVDAATVRSGVIAHGGVLQGERTEIEDPASAGWGSVVAHVGSVQCHSAAATVIDAATAEDGSVVTDCGPVQRQIPPDVL